MSEQAQPDLGVLRRDGEPGRARRHQDRGDLRLAVRPGAGHGGDPDHGGDRGARVGDERLRPVDHPLPARLPFQPRPGCVRIAPATSVPPPGSVSPNAAEPLARAERGQPLPLLLLGAEPVDRHDAEPDPGLERDGDRGVHPGEFLKREAEREVVAAHAAVLLGHRQPEQPHPPHLRDDVVGELALLVQVTDHRRDDVAGELRDALAQVLVLLIQLVAEHQPTPIARFPAASLPVWRWAGHRRPNATRARRPLAAPRPARHPSPQQPR